MADLRPLSLPPGSSVKVISDSDAVIAGQGVVVAEQSTAPSTPATGYGMIYAKSDGKVYFKNDAGAEVLLSRTITHSTSPPSGGSDGDIHLQIL